MHKHKCDCGYIWQHSDSCAMFSEEIFNESHTCARCGKEVTMKYYGWELPAITEVCRQEGIFATA